MEEKLETSKPGPFWQLVEVGQQECDLLSNDALWALITEVEALVGGRHIAIMNQVADPGVHGSGVDRVLSLGVDAITHLRHQTEPDLPRHDLVSL